MQDEDDADSFEVLGSNPRTGVRVAIGERGSDQWYVFVWGRGDTSWRSTAGPLEHAQAFIEAEEYLQSGATHG